MYYQKSVHNLGDFILKWFIRIAWFYIGLTVRMHNLFDVLTGGLNIIGLQQEYHL
jgi:hypothetical protein